MMRIILIYFFLFTTLLLHAAVSPDSLTYSQLKFKIDEAIDNKKTDSLTYYYELLGDMQFDKEQYTEALDAYDRSIVAGKDSLRYYKVALKRMEILKIDLSEEELKEVIQLYHEAKYFYERNKMRAELAHVHAKISIWYKEHDMIEKQNYHINQCIKINDIVKDTLLGIIINIEKSELYQTLDLYKKGLQATEFSLSLSEAIRHQKYIGINKLRKGILLNYLNEFEEASTYLKESEQLLIKQGNFVNLLELYDQISESYASMEKYDEAYYYSHAFSKLNDSMHIAIREAEVDVIRAERKAKEAELENNELKKEKATAEVQNKLKSTLLYSFYFAGLVTLIGLYFIIRFYQQQIKIKETITNKNEEINRQKIVDLENNLKIETMHSMLSGQEAERERIAKDLHDSLGGLLSTLKLQYEFAQDKVPNIDNIKAFDKVSNLLDEACQEVRNISNNMQPGSLNKLGIVAAVTDLTNRFQEERYPDIDFQHYGMETKLESTTRLMVYRIIQELLTNSIKHADASEIIIQLTQKDNELIVMVEDDGKGYDIEKSKKGMGTGNIASRVNYLKGDLSIHSVKDNGTSTMITVPLPV